MTRNTATETEQLPGQDQFTELAADFVYLNNGTQGSMPAPVIHAQVESLKTWAGNPTSSFETDSALGKRQQRNRKRVADFVGVGQEHICLTDNTTMGLDMVLMGLDMRPGDRLVMTDHEHPAMISPIWFLKQRWGVAVEVRSFPPTETLRGMSADELLSWLFPDHAALHGAKALCVSHVYNTTGVRLPLDQLRQRAQALDIGYLIVDGAQGVGMLDLRKPENRLDHCDFYAAPMHKWLNGPPGTGFLYVRDPSLCPPEFYPPLGHKMGAYLCGDRRGACLPVVEALQARGCSNIPGYMGAIEAIAFTERNGGPARVEAHILSLAEKVSELLASRCPECLISPVEPELRSGLVSFFAFDWNQPSGCFRDKETAMRVVKRLGEDRVQVRFVPFPTVDLGDEPHLRRHDPGAVIDCSGEPAEQVFAIRISTGYFNTYRDLEVLEQALQRALTDLG